MSNPVKVLIFDDNQELLELCTIILEESGCRVATTSTSDEADKQVLEVDPDVIFMDNWLPNLSGIEATKLIKNNPLTADIPVIYFTANNNVTELAAQAGADDFLAKPFDIEELEKLVFKHARARVKSRQ